MTDSPGVTDSPDVTGEPGVVVVPGLLSVVGGTGYRVPVPGTGHWTGTGSQCDRYMFRVHWSVDR